MGGGGGSCELDYTGSGYVPISGSFEDEFHKSVGIS
jgi:hypothetical protein